MDAEYLAGFKTINSHSWKQVWRSVKQLDIDKMDVLRLDELEECFKELFPFEMDNKSADHYFSTFMHDQDKSLVNWRNIKKDILMVCSRIEEQDPVLEAGSQ